MTQHRRGSALALILVAVSVALVMAGAFNELCAARQHAAHVHHLRLQARELALGVFRLPPGTRVDIAGWRVVRTADGGAEADGPMGTYRIASDGRESWKRAP